MRKLVNLGQSLVVHVATGVESSRLQAQRVGSDARFTSRCVLGVLLFVVLFNLSRALDRVAEATKVLELAHCCLVHVFDAGESLRAERVLVISKQKTAELLTMEKVLALVFGPGHREDSVPFFALQRRAPAFKLELVTGLLLAHRGV